MRDLADSLATGLRARARLYQRALARLQALRARGPEGAHALWRHVDAILRSTPPLYTAGGLRSVHAFVREALPGETQRSVARNTLVARVFDARAWARFDRGLLEELALYQKARGLLPEPPRTVDLSRLRVEVRARDGSRVARRVEELTVAELRRARRELRGGTPVRRNAPAADSVLRAALAREPALREVGVRTGSDRVNFSDVPLGALQAFARVLLKVQVPGVVRERTRHARGG
jgi:hypothetical protein